MKWLARFVWCSVAVLFTSSAAWAQEPEPGLPQSFSQAELDQMLAPIALYPDSLLSQILMAATYPQDVYEAASWSRVNPELSGDTAVRAVEGESWDPSVISLVAFPQVLAMMDEQRDWTERLGDAYVGQANQVMDSIQELRARADASGTLRSSDEILVKRHGDDYIIEPPTPEVVYVPYYDPRVAYGNWWWSDYQPVYWRPWSGYSYYPRYGGFGWGYGVTLGSGFFFGAIDWPRRYVRYSSHRPWYYRDDRHRPGYRWTHDRDHRWRGDRNRWRDRDRDGRRDGRWRDRDRDGRRDGRWRDRDGDGRRDYRDGRDRRDRPGGRDGRDGRDRREWRGRGPDGGAAVPAPQGAVQQGFFPPRDDARTRAASPAYRTDRNAPRGQPQQRVRQQPRVQQPRVQPQQRVQQQPRVQQPRAQQAPAQRPARQGAPAQRSAPAPQAAPAEKPARSAPAPAPGAEERRGGRGMTR